MLRSKNIENALCSSMVAVCIFAASLSVQMSWPWRIYTDKVPKCLIEDEADE